MLAAVLFAAVVGVARAQFFSPSFFNFQVPPVPAFPGLQAPQSQAMSWPRFGANDLFAPMQQQTTPAPQPVAFMPSLFNFVGSNAAQSQNRPSWSRTYISYQNADQPSPVTIVYVDGEAATTKAAATTPAPTTQPPVPTAGQPAATTTTQAPIFVPVIAPLPSFNLPQQSQQPSGGFPSAPSFNPFAMGLLRRQDNKPVGADAGSSSSSDSNPFSMGLIVPGSSSSDSDDNNNNNPFSLGLLRRVQPLPDPRPPVVLVGSGAGANAGSSSSSDNNNMFKPINFASFQQQSSSSSDNNKPSQMSMPSWFQPMGNFGQVPQMPQFRSGNFWQPPSNNFFSFNPFQ